MKIFLPFVLLALLSCSSENPKLLAEQPGQRKTSGGASYEADAVVDILFIIDDSGSMASHQRNLSTNISLFINELQKNKNLDYHIGVITTTHLEPSVWDPSQAGPPGGELKGSPTVITRASPTAIRDLTRNLLVGTDGGGTEKVFDPAQRALSEPVISQQNQGFLRPDAYLALIVLTDADDASAVQNPLDFYNFLVGLKKNNPAMVLSYGAFIPIGVSGCARDSTAEPYRLTEFFKIAGSLTFNLCDPAFGVQLAGVGKDLVRRVASKIILESRPVLSSIEVVFGSQVISPGLLDGWSYNLDDNSVTFGPKMVWSTQPDGTKVIVSYTAQK